ncbi:MAG TPA: hypothetical protein ACQGQH_09340, partial [Xylella sp.]
QRFIIDAPTTLSTQASTQEFSGSYWTDERTRHAKPQDIPLPAKELSRMEAEASLGSSIQNDNVKEKILAIEPSPAGDWDGHFTIRMFHPRRS